MVRLDTGLCDKRQWQQNARHFGKKKDRDPEPKTPSQGLSPDDAERQAPSDGRHKRPKPRIG